VDLNLNEAIRWMISHGVALVVGVAVVLLAYRLALPAIHRGVPKLLQAQAAALADGSAPPPDELGKRVATLEELLTKLLRVFVLVAIAVVALAVFDLWSVIAGIAIVVAAIMVASQDVVLDYVMGVLILVEGPFFKGDWISIGGAGGGMEGVVQEITLRRTVMRDNLGAMNAVSNGLVRASSNLTRVFSVAVVELQVLRAADLDAAMGLVSRTARELQSDVDWTGRVSNDAADVFVTGLSADGATLRLQLQVPPGARMVVSSELRRRLAAAFADAGVGIGRWETPLPVVTTMERGGASRPTTEAERTSR